MNKYALFSVLLIFIGNTKLNAGGFQINLQGHRSVGMGGAFTAVCSDASAVFYNPGAITSLYGNNIMVGGSFIFPQVSLQTLSTSNINQNSPVGTPIQLYYTKQLSHKWTAGLAINNQFGSNASFEDDWQGKYIVQNIGLTTFMIQPTIALKLDDRLSIGAGFTYVLGDFKYKKAVPVSSASVPYGSALLSGQGSTTGYNLGAYYKVFNSDNPMLESNITLGFSYRSNYLLGLDNGKANFHDIPLSLAAKFPEETSFSSEINLPGVFNAGVYISMLNSENKTFGISFELGKTFWSSYDTLRFDFENQDTPDSEIIKNWKDVFVYRLGVEYSYFDRYYLRGGMYMDNSPIPSGYVSPELPDTDHIGYTLGLGYSVNEQFQIDISYLSSSFMMRGTYNAAGFEAVYNRNVRVIGIGISYQFNQCSLFKKAEKNRDDV